MKVETIARKWPPLAWAAALTLLVAGPWLLPGYIFGTDWPGPRHFLFPNHLWSGVLWEVLLALSGALIGAELVTKLLLLASLFVGALGSYRALPIGGFIPRAVAAVIYTTNPFVYGRIHYGQFALIAAYVLLPWLAIALRRLALRPGVGPTLLTALWLFVIGIVDLHVLVPAGILALSVAVAFAIARWRDGRYLLRFASWGVGAVLLTLLVCSYWLVPLLTGSNQQGQQLAGFTSLDLGIFRTVPDSRLGLLPNVLGLYGFWAENASRFPSMKGFVPIWPVALSAMLLVAAIGVAVTLCRPDADFVGARPWILVLVMAGAVAVVLELGFADPHTRSIVLWLDRRFQAYRGMRDAGKWAALIALVYAQLVPLGAIAVLGWIRRLNWAGPRDLLQAFAAGLFLGLALYYGNGMLFGMHGEVRPSPYPDGWYLADRVLAADPHGGDVAFLPWHLYLRFSFIRNTNAVIANPAPAFFSRPVVVSADPEVSGLNPTNTLQQSTVEALVATGTSGAWSKRLAASNIEYVLLAREVDWTGYSYLDSQNGLTRVGDFGSIVLYRNIDWQPRSR